MNIDRILLALLLIAVGCGSGANRDGLYLDPEIEEALRMENLALFTGNWIMANSGEAMYVEIHEDNTFYWTAEKAKIGIAGGDYGTIRHMNRGKMVFFSSGEECSEKRGYLALMEKSENSLKLRDSEKAEFALDFVATEKRKHPYSMPCTRF